MMRLNPMAFCRNHFAARGGRASFTAFPILYGDLFSFCCHSNYCHSIGKGTDFIKLWRGDELAFPIDITPLTVRFRLDGSQPVLEGSGGCKLGWDNHRSSPIDITPFAVSFGLYRSQSVRKSG